MALSENQKISTIPDITFRDLPVAAGAIHIYKNAILNRNAAGYVVLGSDTTGESFAGIAYEELNQLTGGSAGDNTIKVIQAHSGVTVKLPMSGVVIADVNKDAYVDGDDDLGLVGDTTNDVRAGKIIDIGAANEAFILLD